MCSQPAEPTRRLFFALWPDVDVRASLERLSREQLHTQAKHVPAENLHITVAFPGSVTTSVRDCLEAAAGRIRAAPFDLSIDRLGYWSRPRIIWAGASRTPPELRALVESLRAELDACGLVPETRPYQAHVTLARKAGRGLAVTDIAPIHWSIRHFCLVESVTDPAGARYAVLRRWPLNGA